MTNVLSVKDLSVTYAGGDVPALSSFSLDIAQGEIVALVGESGSGKSTVASAVLGVLPRDAGVTGKITVTAKDETHALNVMSERERDEVRRAALGAVFQDPAQSFDPVFRIGMQLAERLWGVRARKEREARVREALRACGLEDADRVMRAYPHQLSGGMLQRAMIAQALLGEPALLVADEMTSSLDVTVQASLVRMLKTLSTERDMSILFVTHDIALAASFADRMVVLHRGRCVDEGAAREVVASPRHEYTMRLIESVKLCLR